MRQRLGHRIPHWTVHVPTGMSWPSNGSSHDSGRGDGGAASSSSSSKPGDQTPSSSSTSKQPKVCGVCGDRAKSYHFGGISCDSCKAFFRRSVQNEAYRNFHCPYESKCDITITSRKCCQFCRFQKCLSIGMEKGWVMTEEERMQLLRSRLEKRQRQEATSTGKRSRRQSMLLSSPSPSSGHSDYDPDSAELARHMDADEVRTIEDLVNGFELSYRSVPPCKVPPFSKGRTRTEILDLFFTVIQQFAHFARGLEAFSRLLPTDQEVLLRCGVLELCFIRGAHVFDEHNVCWPDRSRPLYKDSPVLLSDDVRKLVSEPLHRKHMRFISTLRELDLDEPSVMMLLVVVLLSPDRPGLSNSEAVAKEQDRYTVLLRKYMAWRYGAEAAATLYPRLLLKLPDLRELTDAHTDYHLLLEKDEVEEVQQRLSTLQLETVQDEPAPCRRGSWSLSLYAASLAPSSSPGSPEEESCSSDGSERLGALKKELG